MTGGTNARVLGRSCAAGGYAAPRARLCSRWIAVRGEVCAVGADYVLLTFPAQMRSPTTSFADKNSVQRLAGDVLPNQAHVTAFNVQVGDGRQHGRAAECSRPHLHAVLETVEQCAARSTVGCHHCASQSLVA